MPLSRPSRRSPRPSRNYHLPPNRRGRFGLDWPMLLAMIGVTIWSCFDGRRNAGMMLAASVATVAAINVLVLLFSGFRPTRLVNAVWSGVLVTIFMPAWDWLSARFLYPESIWTAVGFGAAFGVIRWTLMRGSSRPPS